MLFARYTDHLHRPTRRSVGVKRSSVNFARHVLHGTKIFEKGEEGSSWAGNLTQKTTTPTAWSEEALMWDSYCKSGQRACHCAYARP